MEAPGDGGAGTYHSPVATVPVLHGRVQPWGRPSPWSNPAVLLAGPTAQQALARGPSTVLGPGPSGLAPQGCRPWPPACSLRGLSSRGLQEPGRLPPRSAAPPQPSASRRCLCCFRAQRRDWRGADIWGVGSLACVLGPGSWEAPGTLATAGLELAETCREVWSLPEASATAPASATPNGTFGPWRVQVFGLFSLSPRGLPVLRKIPL